MNEYLFFIIFNTIILFISFKFKKNLMMLYGFIFVLFILYILHLKSKLIEGNVQEDIYKSFKEFESETPEVELPLRKISKILELLLKKMTGEEDTGLKCEGEFAINKLTEKTCGDGFNERIYNITKPGKDCLHTKYYKEKVPLRLCKYKEKCDTDLDCGGGLCKENLCVYELECNETMLSSCNRDMCLELNDGLDRAIYYYQNKECKVDPCNENTYQLCDEGGCTDLSYKYKFSKDKNVCEKVVQDVDTTGLETGSYLNILQSYKDEGGRKSICTKTNGVKSCDIGVDLQPRYYCNDGYWNGLGKMAGTNSECEVCPPGHAGTDGNCEQCGNVHGPNGRRTECAGCDAGDKWTEGICEVCKNGQKPNWERDACEECPQGHAGTGGNCEVCDPGHKPNAEGDACEDCPAGHTGMNGVCEPCSPGKTPDNNQGDCIDCPPGKVGTNGICEVCGNGEEPNAAKTECVGCGLSRAAHPAVPGTCIQCTNGTAPNVLKTMCVACPVGQAGTDGVCSQCGIGMEPDITKTSCSACPYGHKAPLGGICSRCEGGTTSTSPVTDVCEQCAVTDVGADGTCTQCISGMQPSIGQQYCINCPEGSAGTNGTCDQCVSGKIPNNPGFPATECVYQPLDEQCVALPPDPDCSYDAGSDRQWETHTTYDTVESYNCTVFENYISNCCGSNMDNGRGHAGSSGSCENWGELDDFRRNCCSRTPTAMPPEVPPPPAQPPPSPPAPAQPVRTTQNCMDCPSLTQWNTDHEIHDKNEWPCTKFSSQGGECPDIQNCLIFEQKCKGSTR
jgi:hypothetical protein